MKYLNFNELRAKLGNRSRSAVYLDLEAGRIPQPLKLGGRLYWPEDDVDAHLCALRGKSAETLRAEAEAMLAHADALESEGAN
jgi:predicted DNA-binding transcriptional regulator AlpA